MIWQSHGRGTPIVKVRLAGIGKIERASGFTDPTMVRRLKEMLVTLHESGRADDLLRAVKAKRVSLRQVWAVYRQGEWSRLPTAEHAFPFGALFDAWRDTKDTEYARQALWARRALEKVESPRLLGDLPRAVLLLRASCESAGHFAKFNRVLGYMGAFLRDKVTSAHMIAKELAEVVKLTEKVKRPKNAVKPAQALVIREALGGEAGAVWWWMYWHGPIPDEFFAGKCREEDGRLHIRGTKRNARDRFVPLLFGIPETTLTQQQYERTLRRAGVGVRPKDSRDGFALCCDLGGVPWLWREGLLGHARGAMDYGAIENERVLDEIEGKLRQLHAATVAGQMVGQGVAK